MMHNNARLKLLILDDDAMIADTIRRMGEYVGLECKYTVSISEFFVLMRDWCPSVVALDLLMPEMDGLEVIAKLAEQGYSTDLIITSGMGERVLDAARLSASEHGLNTLGVLAKPFSTHALRALLEQAGTSTSNALLVPQSRANEPSLADLKNAIDTKQISVAYQPKIFCRTGTLSGFEVLARWQWHGHWVSPETFIAMAEEHGLIDDLTRLIVEQSLAWFASVSQYVPVAGLTTMRSTTLSLNISAKSLNNQALLNWIVEQCDEWKIERNRLILELTETSATSEFVTALDTLTRLRIKGFHLAIDDFGTGYSSMVQLVQLPFSEIKIDKSFVMANRNSAVSSAVVRSIIDLGRSLNMLSTAEGVEDATTLDFLKELGCDLAQGYHIAKPMPAEAVIPWFERRESTREQSRLVSVNHSTLFGSAPDRNIDRLTELAARLLSVPIALVTVLDHDREWFKSKVGVSITDLPRSESFCTYTIGYDDILVVQDATLDDRFQALNLVQGEEHIRFYAGHPLCLPNGDKIGALCVLDRHIRSLSDSDIHTMKQLSKMVELELAEMLVPVHGPIPELVDKKRFLLRANQTQALATELAQEVTLFYLVLDDLGQINRQLGRDVGDRFLQRLVDVVIAATGVSDLIGRYRGAEIVILRVGESAQVSQHLQAAIAQCLIQQSEALAMPVNVLFASVALAPTTTMTLGCAVETARSSAIVIGS
ncbi:EAL domain-containing protein [Marinomonas sp. M1K-6]|uniref:EAL domain-containing protein n=1 Tax=Marinomonas profundi TaxID=2726122 RepID=A0A847QZZ8_9GAMM|nr:EAL domain-containing protein [Marinomonas profundi]NLQ16632.1 EAL domain-containing protein [Marinomonas profundi]UDV03786.1 EAL domain-containing protein [Marinomonas profundi]